MEKTRELTQQLNDNLQLVLATDRNSKLQRAGFIHKSTGHLFIFDKNYTAEYNKQEVEEEFNIFVISNRYFNS